MTSNNKNLFLYTTALLIFILGYGTYKYNNIQNSLSELSTTSENQIRKIAQLERIIDVQTEENAGLIEKLGIEKSRNDSFAEQIGQIAGTVGTLEKLSKTDEELLQKYSKVYFLNEHYIPTDLAYINPTYLYDESKQQQTHKRVYSYLERMVQDALEDGVKLFVKSAYRSFDTQSQLKSSYTVTYGSGANTFSADQGYSEHQLGTTVDFTTVGINGGFENFENTPAYKWLQNNAHLYGFTLSYPDKNGYYIFEPWHWRFVGKDLATHLHEENLYFYDMSQRDIDEYLVNIFD